MSADTPVIDGTRREALRLAANALSLFDRAALARSLSGEGERDLDRDLGYPRGFVPREAYQDLYDRHAIANRVVNVYPRETWRVSPSCYETEDPEEETPFEAALAALGRSLRPEKSYHQDEQGGALWEYLSRLDELSGVGQYGVMLLGVNDDLELSRPARFAPGSVAPGADVSGARATSYGTRNANGGGKSGRKLTFLRVFPESMATVNAFDGDERSPRFGQPTEYTLTFVDPQQQSAGALGTVRKPVHWTRVLHVADNLGSSEVFGVPRMRPVLNNLLDLKKVHGGSAEMYYQGALPGWSFETNPMLGGDVEIDLDKLREAFRKWKEGLQRFMVAVGASIKSLAPQVVDPSPQIDKQIEAICIQIGVPVRIFKGSERGQLASGQDDDAWNDRCRQRQLGYVTPRIIVPFVDRLIALGVLPAPEDGYSVSWPDLATRNDEQKAAIAQQRGAAVVAYGNSAGTQDQMTATDFYVKVMGFTEAEATALVENADQARAERQAEEAKAAAEQARQAAQDHARQLELAKARQQPPPGPDGPTGAGASGGTDGQPPGGGNSPGAGTTPAASGGTQNYDPSQPRLPGGGTGAGRWAAGDALAGLGRLDARRHAGTHGPASGDVDPPFAVTDARPWETAAEGLPEEEATVSLSALHASKPRLSARSLRHFAAGGSAGDAPAPRVWLTPEGRHVIEDGAHRLAAERLRGKGEARVRLVRWQGREGGVLPAGNVFCPTGAGGGVDPSCSPGGGAGTRAGFTAALGKAALSPKKREEFREAADEVFGRLSPGALARFGANVKGYSLHPDTGSLTKGLVEGRPDVAQMMGRDHAAGAYVNSTGVLWLDSHGRTLFGHEVYAHEFGHAVDGPARELSGSTAWHDAWKSELVGKGGLSEYAKTSPSEGFAEFSRLVHSSDDGRGKAERAFPACAAYWKERGVW